MSDISRKIDISVKSVTAQCMNRDVYRLTVLQAVSGISCGAG